MKSDPKKTPQKKTPKRSPARQPEPAPKCANCSAHERAPGHTVCKRCLELMRRGQAQRRQRWRATGMCILCGRPRYLDYSCCLPCREKKRKNAAKRSAALRKSRRTA